MKRFAVVVNFKSFEFDTFAEAYDCYVKHITNPELYECEVVTLYKDSKTFVQWIAKAMAH